MSAENSATMRLIRQELARFNIDVRLLIESALPAFEIRVVDRTWQIAAPDEIELLYGVYDCAERFFGWDFFEPGKMPFTLTPCCRCRRMASWYRRSNPA